MYTDYWGLKKPPFDNVPDPTMYVEAHLSVENTVAETLFAIEEGNECLTVIVGTVGLGKTLSLRMILDLLDHEKYKIAFVTNPDMSFVQLLREIIGQLTGKECDVKGKIELLEVFNKLLFSTADEGKKVLVFIDEANAISPANLESLRLLTNMQDDDRNLFTIVLAGQMEFAKKLEHPNRANLFQRIGTYNRIEKMGNEDLVKKYVETRLKLAGTTRHVFTDDAIHALWEYSEHGVPRLVNKIAKLCLKAGETNNFNIITGEVVQQIGDRFDKMTGPSVQKRRFAKTPTLKAPGQGIVEGRTEKKKQQESPVIKREHVPVHEPPPPAIEPILEVAEVPQKVEPPPPPAIEPIPEAVVATPEVEAELPPVIEPILEIAEVPQKVEPPPPPAIEPIPEAVVTTPEVEAEPPPAIEPIPEAIAAPQKVEPPPPIIEPILEVAEVPQKVEPPPPPAIEPIPEAVVTPPEVELEPSPSPRSEPLLDWSTLKRIEEELKEPVPEPALTPPKAEPSAPPKPESPMDWSTLKKIAEEFKDPVVETIEPLPTREVAAGPVRSAFAEEKRELRPPIEKPPQASDDTGIVNIAGNRVRIEIPAHIMEQTRFSDNEQRKKIAGVLAAQTLEKNPQLTSSPTVDPVSVWSEILGIIMKRIEK